MTKSYFEHNARTPELDVVEFTPDPKDVSYIVEERPLSTKEIEYLTYLCAFDSEED